MSALVWLWRGLDALAGPWVASALLLYLAVMALVAALLVGAVAVETVRAVRRRVRRTRVARELRLIHRSAYAERPRGPYAS